MSDYFPPAAVPAHVLRRVDVQEALARRDFGSLFFLMRKWSGISYSKIALACDIKPERVGQLARGHGAITTYDKFVQICDGLRIPGHFLGLLPRPWESPADHGTLTRTESAPAAIELAGQLYESELLHHLNEQWHHLVKTDNLLGPRAALRGVRDQLRVIDELLDLTASNAPMRSGLLALAARYAESASWLYEDSGDLTRAHDWSGRAVQWAYEAADEPMLAWAYFRKSQQARTPEHALSLAHTAQRHEEQLPAPIRAALLQHQATTLARTDESSTAHHYFDHALEWAVGTDVYGDARAGHGSFCTPDYIELERARAWTQLGSPQRAVDLFEEVIPRLPVVYQRDRGVALARCADAYAGLGEAEHAADLAREALDIAHTTGTGRVVNDLAALAGTLQEHRGVGAVDALLTELAVTREY